MGDLCSECGGENSQEAKFCSSCGALLNRVQAPAVNQEFHERVNRLSWGGFRHFWESSAVTITPDLVGVTDIEGGEFGISGGFFTNCDSCYMNGAGIQFDCLVCGRNRENYLRIRSGWGDGVYATYQLWFDGRVMGSLTIFDQNNHHVQILQNHIEEGLELWEKEEFDWTHFLAEFYDSIYKDLDSSAKFDPDLEMHYFGAVIAEKHPYFSSEFFPAGRMICGESGEGINSNSVLLTLNNVQSTKHNVYAFCSKDLELGNVLIPQIVITLRADMASEIGLDPDNFDGLNLTEVADNWSSGLVAANLSGPNNTAAAYFNLKWTFLSLQVAVQRKADNATLTDLRVEVDSWKHFLKHIDPDSDFTLYYPDSTISPSLRGLKPEGG